MKSTLIPETERSNCIQIANALCMSGNGASYHDLSIRMNACAHSKLSSFPETERTDGLLNQNDSFVSGNAADVTTGVNLVGLEMHIGFWSSHRGAFSLLARELTSALNFSLFSETNRDDKVVSGIKGVDFNVSGNNMNSICFPKYSLCRSKGWTGQEWPHQGLKTRYASISKWICSKSASQL